MNTFSKNTKALFALLLSCCLVVAGCKDDDDPIEEPAATITSINPTSGPVGTQVTIVGDNFGSAASDIQVDFNGTQAQVNSVSNQQIVVTVPEGATTGNLNLVARGKTVTGPAFTVTEEAGATITSIDPTSGPVGTQVVITGTGFGEELSSQIVAFNGVEAEITALNDEEITVFVPTGATTGTITFKRGETTVEGPEFTVEEAEVETGITSIAPNAGPVGTEVTLLGNGFGDAVDDHIVYFNGVEAEITAVSNQEITAVVPATATTGMVSLNMGGTTYEGPDFTVTKSTGGIYYGEGFTLDAPIAVNGQAALQEGLGINGETILRLTPAKADRTSSAYYQDKMPVVGGFETTFGFRISRPGKPEGVEGERGADGFSFIIQNQGLEAYGGRGPDKGYGGIMNAVVVDFDIYQNAEDGDPNGNHVSVQVSRGNGAVQADENYRIAIGSSSTHEGLPVDFISNEQESHTARVVYTPAAAEGEKGLLQIYIDNMEAPLEAEINLEDYLNSEDGSAYVGFTASTNQAYGWAAHDILNWTFQPAE